MRTDTIPQRPNISQAPTSSFTILRRKQVERETGYSRSTIYLRISQRLWPKPINLGPRAVGWPASEVEALNAARIAGKTDDEIRELVGRLERARTADGDAPR
jgi:prophage regulatory protein